MDNQREKSAKAIAELFAFDETVKQKFYEVLVFVPEAKDRKSVYIFDTDTGIVKIGVATDCDKRLATLSRTGGYKILNRFISQPIDNAFAIESAMHRHFASRCKCGEYFYCRFEDAVSHLVSLI